MLTIDQCQHKITGQPLPAFFVRNRTGKALAIGAKCKNGDGGFDGFVMPSRKRYARDTDLCRAIAALTGLPIKWNLSAWCKHLTSGTEQELMKIVRRTRAR